MFEEPELLCFLILGSVSLCKSAVQKAGFMQHGFWFCLHRKDNLAKKSFTNFRWNSRFQNIRNRENEPGESLAQQLRTLIDLVEHQGLISSTHIEVHNCLYF